MFDNYQQSHSRPTKSQCLFGADISEQLGFRDTMQSTSGKYIGNRQASDNYKMLCRGLNQQTDCFTVGRNIYQVTHDNRLAAANKAALNKA